MTYNVKALTTALLETKRFASYASDSFRLAPGRRLIISQHEDCLFAFPETEQNETEDTVFSESLIEGEGEEISKEHLRRAFVSDRDPVCLLDANEDNLYNDSTRGPKCIYLAGGIASYGVNNAGDALAVAFCSGILAFYDIVTEDGDIYLSKKREVKTNTKNVSYICFDTSDAYTACGTVDGAIAVYHEGGLIRNFHHQKGAISVMRFHPKTLRLLAGSQYGDITMYCIKSNAPIAMFQGHLSHVNDIAFLIADDESQEGFVSCSRDSNVCFWSLAMTNKEVKKAVAAGSAIVKKPFKRIVEYESIISISIVTDGLNNYGSSPWALFLATESGVLKYIDPASEKTIAERKATYGQGAELKCATLSRGTKQIIALGSSGTLCFYSINLELKHHFMSNIDGAFQFQLYKMNNAHTESCSKLSDDDNDVSMDGYGSDDSNEENKTIEGNDEKHLESAEIPLDESMNIEGSKISVLRDEIVTQQQSETVETYRSDWNHSLQWINKQIRKGIPLVFILCGDDCVRLMALGGKGSCITIGLANESYRHEDTVLAIACAPSLNILASGGKDERVLIWDLRTLAVVATISLDGLNVACLALQWGLSDGSTQFRMVAAGDNVLKSFDVPISWERSYDKGITFDDVTHVKPAAITIATATVVTHKKPINAVAFSPNNKMVASVGADKIVVIYAAYNLIVKGKCIGHRRSVLSVAFTRINKTVVSSSVDMTIKIWSLNDFSCIKTLQGHNKAVMKVAILPNDLQLLSVGMDGLLKIWNIRTSDCIFTGDNHSDKVWNAEISGSNVLSISGNGIMIWWDDISADMEAKKMLEERDEELKRTQVESLAADGKYSEALCLSMELRKPNMASKILQRRCAMQLFRIEKEPTIDHDIFNAWVQRLKTLPDTKKMLTIAFDFIKLWNSRSSTCWMANGLLAELFKQFTPSELLVVEGMRNRIESLLAQQSSHLTRFINLSEKSHLLDIIVGFRISEPKKKDNSTLAQEILYG